MNQLFTNQIFLVDDDEDDQYLISRTLNEQTPNARVRVLNDGIDLLTALAEDTSLPQLVLLDMNMPRMGGLEALSHIRATQAYAGLPVIMLTTSDNDRDRQRAIELSANDYLIKPSSMKQLSQLMGQLKHQWLNPQNA